MLIITTTMKNGATALHRAVAWDYVGVALFLLSADRGCLEMRDNVSTEKYVITM